MAAGCPKKLHEHLPLRREGTPRAKAKANAGTAHDVLACRPLMKTATEVEGEEIRRRPDSSEMQAASAPRPAVAFYKLFGQADWVDAVAMLAGGLAGTAHGATMPMFLLFLGKLIDSLGSFSDSALAPMAKQVSKYALYFVYLSVVRFGTGWTEVSMWMFTGERQAARLRIRYVKALLSQDVGFFDTNISTGEVVAGIASDTTLVQEAIGSKTGNLFHHMGQFVCGMVLAFLSVWQLSLLTLAVLPVIALAGGFCAYVMIGIAARNQGAYSRAAEVAFEVIAQMRIVHSFVGEKKAFQSYSDALQSTKKLGIKAGFAKGLGIGLLYGMAFTSFALLLWFAGRLIRNGISTGGEAFTTILNVVSSSLALGQAAPDIATISRAKAAGYTILKMINRKPMISHNNDGLTLEQISGTIELRNVSFSYPSRPDINIFQKFSLFIPAGKVVAIVGGSGAGKSTVISLIERFYDPTAGEVLLDGHNIKTMRLKWLRNQMGLVSQEPALFATSIQENIMYGKAGDVSLDDVVKAASIACANTFIDVLPKRYETLVGERGVQLSGGQKQRIAIARAMLKNPSILLLDEATSALDSDSEKSVQEALDRVMLGRTTVVVAHRLSTIQNADIIAVVEDGKVAELGSHKELIEKDSLYATLVKIQKNGPAADSRIGRGSMDRTLSQRSLVQRSLSQRTFSFGSITDVVNGQALIGNEPEPNFDNLVGPKASLIKMMRMNASDWPFALLGAVGAIIAGAQIPIFASIITQALEYFYQPDMAVMKRGLQTVSFRCCGVGVLIAMAYITEFYFTGVAGERVTLRVRKAMFSAILKNEISWFDLHSSTLLASRLSADAPLVKGAIVDRIITLLQNLGLIVTAFYITLNLQWKITLIMLITFPVLIASYVGQMQFMKGFSGDLHMAYMRANTVAGEAISNIRTVAAFSAEDKVLNLFSKELSAPRKKAFVRGQVAGIGFGVSQFVVFCWCGLALWYGSVLIRKGEATFGQSMKCFMVLVITAFGIAETLSMAPDLLHGTKTLQGVFNILYRQSEIDVEDPSAEEVHAVNGTIELRHKQRVAIARAVLKNPAILLLDEATSALDMESEKLVQEALNNMMQHRTTVLVAHRLSTVKNAHSIAVLENGSIKEQGSHNELIAKEGTYFQLLNLSGTENS
ncbi:hypothetical protein GOP47_0026857 [Adiantum capillus-veneris]|nr:hypothetical protein GOP47_0026857 [Adiantum capillus-veneris]